MALYRTNVALKCTTGLPKDDVVNTFHWLTTEPDHTVAVASALNGHVAAAYNAVQAPGTATLASRIGKSVSRSTLPVAKTYDGAAPGSPIATSTFAAFALQTADLELPREVALCLSYRADITDVPEEAPDDIDADAAPERPASRRRGRVFIGPLTEEALDAPTVFPSRPNLTTRNILLGFAEFLANPTNATLTGVATTWVVRSDSGVGVNTYPVVHAWVDNEWDTQRRRGVSSTSRVTLTLP